MHYVYLVTSDNKIRYIGKGTKTRWKHAINGTSSNSQLNKDYFEGKHLKVYIHSYHCDSGSALEAESSIINYLRGLGHELYNNRHHKFSNSEYCFVDNLDFTGCNYKGCSCVGNNPSKEIDLLINPDEMLTKKLTNQRKKFLTRNDGYDVRDSMASYIENSLQDGVKDDAVPWYDKID